MPKVSICIPAYKEVSFLERCLDSIAIQTYTDYEIIITDDSPGDNIGELVRKYNHLPINYHKNLKSLGSPDNWNKAISMASGEYIKIMHYDDWFASSESLKKMVKPLEEDLRISFVFCAFAEVGENHVIHRYPTFIELFYLKRNPKVLGLGNFIGPPSVTLYRNYPEFTFDNYLVWFVDIEQYIRILIQLRRFVYINEELVYNGYSEKQITRRCINNQELIERERNYLNNKLDIKYNIPFLVYHTIKNVCIPTVKKFLGIKRRLL
ncbi:glycosyltransferase [Bacteroidales bacterium OttesenSCG-928-M06]|nr:glycosyltransferase [Bacteroidales bacterium OttesenSCG-928-M06]